MGFLRTSSSTTSSDHHLTAASTFPSIMQDPGSFRQQIVLQIPECTLHLMDGGESMELARGEFSVVKILDDNQVCMTTIIRVGGDVQWPLTKDEPVLKLDSSHYLFTLPMNDGDPLSYGVTFPEQCVSSSSLGSLDSFLKENSCFSDSSSTTKRGLDWKDFAPSIDNYNNILAKAIAGGTGQIVKGIFICSNAYTNQVQKGGEMIVAQADHQERNRSFAPNETNKGGINKSLKRVRKVSKTTEGMSKSLLKGVNVVADAVMNPLFKSKPGRSFFTMLPGEVILASLDAVNKVIDAAEAAERQTLYATSQAATRAVSQRFGESAGEATEDILATAGHVAGTALNMFKIRKALCPSSSVTSGIVKQARKNKVRSDLKT